MLTVATCLWDPNPLSFHFSRCYDESWVDKLYRGFARNLTVPFEFRCFVDKSRRFGESAIRQSMLHEDPIGYGSYIEPFRLGVPTILVGLDTLVLRNIDHLADYCMTADKVALPRDPYKLERSCNGVALIPADSEEIYYRWDRVENDMEYLRKQETVFIDDLWPGQVVSFKGHVLGQTARICGGRTHDEPKGIDGVDIVYFHGEPKMHSLPHLEWVREHWK